MAAATAPNDESQSRWHNLDFLLDDTLERLARHDAVGAAMCALAAGLGEIYSGSDRASWSDVVAMCKAHPLYAVLGEDPLTHRARAKPPGYAGDAVMHDYIYRGFRHASPSPLGREIFTYTARYSRAARSVLERRERVAHRIDATSEQRRRPRILSVGCGHLREAALSKAVRTGAIELLCALDPDPDSLGVVSRQYGDLPGIELIAASVTDLVKGTLRFADFDLIYAANLYDHLPDGVARSLLTVLAAGLNNGGALLIANSLPAPATVGFMEAFMDRSLVWRTENELAALARGIPAATVTSIRSDVDSTETIAYLEVTRT
jgi:extracellular factor (EF) 3-hydroxypalmitic acid methyl ester biosynthesis protein